MGGGRCTGHTCISTCVLLLYALVSECPVLGKCHLCWPSLGDREPLLCLCPSSCPLLHHLPMEEGLPEELKQCWKVSQARRGRRLSPALIFPAKAPCLRWPNDTVTVSPGSHLPSVIGTLIYID